MPPRLLPDDPTVLAEWRDLVGLEADTNTYNWIHYKKIACRLADRVMVLERDVARLAETAPAHRRRPRPGAHVPATLI